jgi:hypothetical protein
MSVDHEAMSACIQWMSVDIVPMSACIEVMSTRREGLQGDLNQCNPTRGQCTLALKESAAPPSGTEGFSSGGRGKSLSIEKRGAVLPKTCTLISAG